MISVACRRSIFLLITMLLQGPLLFPQGKRAGEESPDRNQANFKIAVGVVIVNATVTDNNGNPVEDLTPEDFRVYEDGKLQRIESFVLENYGSIRDSVSTPGKLLPGETATAEQSPSRPRMISIMIDDVASAPDDHFHLVQDAVLVTRPFEKRADWRRGRGLLPCSH